jgi:micrococcal nuclease
VREQLAAVLRRALVAVIAVVALGVAASPAAAMTLRGTVSAVVDGDTVKVVARGFETPVRLIGIDTPETRAPGKPVQCFGPAATARTKRLLPVGQKVRLVTDPTQDTRDRYARLLAYVYKPGRKGPTSSVNYSLVASGHAKVYVYGGVRFRYAVPLFKAQHRARKAKRGLWGPPCRGNTRKPDPSQPKAKSPATPKTPDQPKPRRGCDPNYTGACIPPYPPDLDCREIPYRNFRSVGTDPHNFDVDHDGVACEE